MDDRLLTVDEIEEGFAEFQMKLICPQETNTRRYYRFGTFNWFEGRPDFTAVIDSGITRDLFEVLPGASFNISVWQGHEKSFIESPYYVSPIYTGYDRNFQLNLNRRLGAIGSEVIRAGLYKYRSNLKGKNHAY